MILVALALLAIPFAFGLLRFASTGDDWRYLAVALGSLLGALAVLQGNRASGAMSLPRTLGAAFTSAVAAAITAWLVGARSVVSIAVVATFPAIASALAAHLR
jgi:hypothetical protein